MSMDDLTCHRAFKGLYSSYVLKRHSEHDKELHALLLLHFELYCNVET
jgi:hypothetical protein